MFVEYFGPRFGVIARIPRETRSQHEPRRSSIERSPQREESTVGV